MYWGECTKNCQKMCCSVKEFDIVTRFAVETIPAFLKKLEFVIDPYAEMLVPLTN